MDLAAFHLAVGLGGLLHGYGFMRAEAELAIGEQGDRFIKGAGSRPSVRSDSVTPKSAAPGSDKVPGGPGPAPRAGHPDHVRGGCWVHAAMVECGQVTWPHRDQLTAWG